MGSSLKIALKHLIENHPDVDTAVITLVDLIDLTPEAINHMILSPGELLQATYNGEIGHPVKLGREHWAALFDELSGDMGARSDAQECHTSSCSPLYLMPTFCTSVFLQPCRQFTWVMVPTSQ